MSKKKIDWLAVLSFVLGLLSISGLLEWLNIQPKDTVHPLKYYGLPCAGIIIVTVSFYWAGMRFRELNRIRAAFARMHIISHKFRDALHDVLQRKNRPDPAFDKKHEQDIEKSLLNAVCEDCSELFRNLTGDRSLACIRLVSVTHVTPTCFLGGHCNNHVAAYRGLNFEIVIDQHTRYQHVFNNNVTTETLHYFSPDVKKETHYKEPSQDQEPYRSTIVVPIRCVKEPKLFLGFLKVQTDKPQRLNGHWHVELLAMLADEIFSYLDCSRAIREYK